MKFKIEQWFLYGWDDMSDETFGSAAEARADLDATLSDMEEAAREGYLSDRPKRSDYRVVPVKRRDTRRERKDQYYR